MNLPAETNLRSAQYSAWARGRLMATPGLDTRIAELADKPFSLAPHAAAIAALPPAEVSRALRLLRRDLMLTVMERDLRGAATLGEVTQAMSALADLAITEGLRAASALLQPEFGLPVDEHGCAMQLHVIGMGKLGGHELNVSSDIDLVFLHAGPGSTTGGAQSIAAAEYFERLGRELIRIISEVSADGYVFRVDMRLRPWGDGPLSLSLDALEQYFVAHGRDWERYAWIKARLITGDQGAALDALVTPFVYRRYLDFGAIESLKSLHAQIRAEVAQRARADHVKLGPGGIREIEFIAQAAQLIRGGRDPGLSVRPTLTCLDQLVLRGLMPASERDALAAAYDFLRRVEHRLQYVEDAQTHTLPPPGAARDALAASMGFETTVAFDAALSAHRAQVSSLFEQSLGAPANQAASTTGDALKMPSHQGFSEYAELDRLLNAVLGGSKVARLTPSARERLDALVPRLWDAARATQAPDAAMKRLIHFTETIASRSSYTALLGQAPAALQRVAELFAASGWAASYLTQHPILLDELLDARSLREATNAQQFGETTRARVDAAHGDVEAQMNLLREAHQAEVLRLLTLDLSGAFSVEALADKLSALADTALAITLDACWRALQLAHRPDAQFAVIAYGKLGGKELGYASDLDLIFVYADEHERAAEIYARLAQRIITFLDTRTTAGRLFEIDTRLRPDGAAGLLVTSLDAFRSYQRDRAWTWEHQALTRARFCAGNVEIGQAFEDERLQILQRKRDPVKLLEDVRSMRKRVRDGHPNKTALFDVKHDYGGMVDVEFAVQALVLAHAHAHPALLANVGNIALLKRAAQDGLIAQDVAQAAADAYRSLRKHQHALRLANAEADSSRLPRELVQNEIAAVEALARTAGLR